VNLGLYRIYFFQSGRSWILPDFEWQIRPEPEPEPDFQIDCNVTNLMCKNITNIRVIWVFDYFLCSSYRYIIYMHSRSNLCHSNVTSTYIEYSKNWLFKSGKTIRLRWDFCRSRIWKSAGFRPEPEPKSGTALDESPLEWGGVDP